MYIECPSTHNPKQSENNVSKLNFPCSLSPPMFSCMSKKLIIMTMSDLLLKHQLGLLWPSPLLDLINCRWTSRKIFVLPWAWLMSVFLMTHGITRKTKSSVCTTPLPPPPPPPPPSSSFYCSSVCNQTADFKLIEKKTQTWVYKMIRCDW